MASRTGGLRAGDSGTGEAEVSSSGSPGLLARLRRWLTEVPDKPETLRRADETGYELPDGFRVLLREAAIRWMGRRPICWLPRRLRYELLHVRLHRRRPLLPWAASDQLDLLLQVLDDDLARHAESRELTELTTPEDLLQAVAREGEERE